MAAAAICSGVIGQCGLLVSLVSSPVMAQVMMTSEFMVAGPRAHGARHAVILSLQQYNEPARRGKPRALAAGDWSGSVRWSSIPGPSSSGFLRKWARGVRSAR